MKREEEEEEEEKNNIQPIVDNSKPANISKLPVWRIEEHLIYLLKRQEKKKFFTEGMPKDLQAAKVLLNWADTCIFGLWKRVSPGGYNLTYVNLTWIGM
jgi:hypothetical protein